MRSRNDLDWSIFFHDRVQSNDGQCGVDFGDETKVGTAKSRVQREDNSCVQEAISRVCQSLQGGAEIEEECSSNRVLMAFRNTFQGCFTIMKLRN